jgi:signal transduction histidine kinase/ActR/RegA family two-component response regulator
MASLDQGIRLARSVRLDAATKRAADDGRDMAELRAALDRLAAREAEQETAARAEYRRFSADAQRRQTVLAAATLIALLLATAALVLEQLGARRAARVQAQLTRELGDARRSAEQANTAKSRFLATASHDMRQPLHALTLYIASLQRRVDTSDARDILGKMNVAVRSMTRLFNALLDMARLEAGVLKPDVGEFALDDLLEEVAAQALESRQISTARLRIVRTRLRVRSDPDLLVIVLRNLANNALKHSGGARVLLGCRRSGSAVSIEVHDDGQGIPADQLQALFGEFVRGERAASKEGVGLGLAIVERVSELLDHPLEVRSEVGRGSVFSIRVPRALARPEAARPLPARIGLDGARILLADDDPLVLDAMRRALEDAGAGVTAAATSEEARRKAQAGAYDLLILDLNLGRDNGLRILEELEASGLDAPGLIVTGATTPELLQQLRRAGRRWLTKPLTADEVAAAAGDLLRTPSARRPSSSRSPPPASGRREPDRSPPGGF